MRIPARYGPRPLILRVCVSQVFVVKAVNSSWSKLLILPKRATSCSRLRDCYSGSRSSLLSAWGFRSPHLPAPNQFPSLASMTERFPHCSEGHPRPLTSLLGCFVVRLAHQPAVFHEVELVPCGQLPLANHAGKAMQVVYEVLGAAHHLRGRDAQLACGAFGPEAPAGCTGCGSVEP